MRLPTTDFVTSLQDLRGRIFSPAEYRQALERVIASIGDVVAGIAFEVTGPAPFDPFIITMGDTSAAQFRDTVELGGKSNIASVSVAYRHNTIESSTKTKIQAFLSQSLVEYWRGPQRDEKGKILSTHFPDLQTALEATAANWVQTGPVALIFADIDNFKAFNDARGAGDGDRLIAKLSASLARHVPETHILVHRTGDEFVILAPITTRSELILSTVDLRRRAIADLVDGEIASPAGKELGLSMGISITDSPVEYAELEHRADRALKPEGAKLRGMVSLAPGEFLVGLAESDITSHELTLSALSQLGTREAFPDIWSNVLSEGIFETARATETPGNLQHSVREQLELLKSSTILGKTTLQPYTPDMPSDDRLQRLQRLLGIAHGLGRARLLGVASISEPPVVRVNSEGAVNISCNGDDLIWNDLEPETLCQPLYFPDREWEANHPPTNFSSAVGVQVMIGEASSTIIPKQVFADRIYVDDRPTRGGGLPDFWEAALAQVVESTIRFPNIDRVVVSGDRRYGVATLQHLQSASTWGERDSVDYLAAKLGTGTLTIHVASERLGDKVLVTDERPEAINYLLSAFSRARVLKRSPSTAALTEPPRLIRTLAVDDLRLPPEAGCRVATAYDAFPIALELARQSDVPTLTDQAGRTLKELFDFRIELTDPMHDRVPRFHARQESEMNDYFQAQFVVEDGLFRASLDANDQLNRVVRHVAQLVNGSERITSRRAILVIPHVPEADGSLAPLGLVAIRLSPRPSARGNRTTIDFSHSWRTVEALVGLPYSLYGSIRFSELLTDMVNEVAGDSNAIMGKVSYIAHSLHMFVDEYHEKLARKIVNDETT